MTEKHRSDPDPPLLSPDEPAWDQPPAMALEKVKDELEARGISVRPGSIRLLSEEADYASKDVSEVARVGEEAGLAAMVDRLRLIGVVKG